MWTSGHLRGLDRNFLQIREIKERDGASNPPHPESREKVVGVG